jgi:hypothetical protein
LAAGLCVSAALVCVVVEWEALDPPQPATATAEATPINSARLTYSVLFIVARWNT